jgi:hypothetical protein
MLLDEKVAALARALGEASLPHAFGGAIALAYHATPRGTRDVDVNVFLPATAFDTVLVTIVPLGVSPPTAQLRKTLERDEQVRLDWDGTPLDVFFSYNELHDACMQRRRQVPFGNERLWILSAEDLTIFKVLFSRDKDWRDIREILVAQPDLDVQYAMGWLERILESSDARFSRFRELTAGR